MRGRRPPKRLAPQLNRLPPVLEQLIQTKPDQWQELVSWCSSIGYPVKDLALHIRTTRVGRRLWQQTLESKTPETRERIEELLKAYQQAEPLFRILDALSLSKSSARPCHAQVGSPTPRSAKQNLVNRIASVLERYMDDLQGPDPQRTLPRHRPQDPWIRPYVLGLAREFSRRGLSKKKIRARIAQIAAFADQDDLVTEHVVRDILRRNRGWAS